MIENTREAFVDIAYFIAAIGLIFSLNRLASPRTAPLGSLIAVGGLLLAIIATPFLVEIERNYVVMALALVVGGSVGFVMANRVQMTAMPQMVAIFNGFGGAASALIAVAEILDVDTLDRGTTLSIALGCIIGSVTATGSAVAFGKLQGLIPGTPVVIGDRRMVAVSLLGGLAVLAILTVWFQDGATAQSALVLTFFVALAAGLLLVLPIGGADMPVVIAILNAASGVAVVLTGVILNMQLLIIAGALVGASGIFLSLLMAKAMNRSLVNVIFGSFGASADPSAAAGTGEVKPIREITPEDAAVSLGYAQRVIVVPGYGLAVAQAQHAVGELAEMLKRRGVDVRYAIHPVAGRMPGHMNVLLAEANVPYDDLYEMDRINSEFSKTDVAIVIGANDVTNPAARDDPSSPIYGMPVLKVDEARSIIVLKRGMSPGFAGVENELFHNAKTTMLFGDAKASLSRLIGEVNAL